MRPRTLSLLQTLFCSSRLLGQSDDTSWFTMSTRARIQIRVEVKERRQERASPLSHSRNCSHSFRKTLQPSTVRRLPPCVTDHLNSSTEPSPSSSSQHQETCSEDSTVHLISASATIRLLLLSSSYRVAGGRVLIISSTLSSISTRQPAATCCSHIHLHVLFVEDAQYSLHISILFTRCHQDASIRWEERSTPAIVALPFFVDSSCLSRNATDRSYCACSLFFETMEWTQEYCNQSTRLEKADTRSPIAQLAYQNH